jgi:hypothetical protein
MREKEAGKKNNTTMPNRQSHNIWIILFWLGLLVILLSHAVLIYRGKAMTRDETRNHAWLNMFAGFLILASALKYKEAIHKKIKYLKGEVGIGPDDIRDDIREAIAQEPSSGKGATGGWADPFDLGKGGLGGSFDDFLRRFDNQ